MAPKSSSLRSDTFWGPLTVGGITMLRSRSPYCQDCGRCFDLEELPQRAEVERITREVLRRLQERVSWGTSEGRGRSTLSCGDLVELIKL